VKVLGTIYFAANNMVETILEKVLCFFFSRKRIKNKIKKKTEAG
jgi:hypothetical protein